MYRQLRTQVIGFLNNRRNRAKLVRGIAGAYGALSKSEYEAHTADGQVPAVYVGTYAKYNNGSLFGQWVDITSFRDFDEFMDYLYRLHADERDPEFMMQDFENFPEEWYSEFGLTEEWFDRINYYYQSNNQKAIDAYISLFGDWDERKFENRYEGEYESMLDFAYWLVDELGIDNVDSKRYFDYEAFARDLENDYHEQDGFIFRAY